MTNLISSKKQLEKTFKLQKELLKTEIDHDEIDYGNYEDKKGDWLDYVKQDVLCNAFSYARYCKAMEEKTAFSMKFSLSASGRGCKYFNCMRDENDEPIKTYIDNYMKSFFRQSVKGDALVALTNIINI